MNKTKILATVGPATTDKEILRGMIKTGMDCVRINFSHASFDFADDVISKVRELNQELNTNVAILIDTAGPEIRVGALREKEISFKLNDDVTISKDDIIGDERCFCTNYKDFVNDIEVGKKIILNNGSVELNVKYRDNYNVYCNVTREGKIKPRSHVNVPGVNLNIPFLSDNDKEVIKYASNVKADYLAVSYIKTLADVLEINDMLISLNDDHMQIISKIENEEAVSNIDEILKVSEGIMVARGDLGLEIALEKIPSIQKEIVNKAVEMNKLTIVATEMLASMVNKPYPTRAEVSDIANAVIDGVDTVMLSEETAIGSYPIQAIEYMNKIIGEAEEHLDYNAVLKSYLRKEKTDATTSIAYSVTDCANRLNAKAIVVPTMSGYTAKQVSHFHPSSPILVTSPNKDTILSLSLYWGIVPLLVNYADTTDQIIEESRSLAIKALNLQKDDIIIITGGIPLESTKTTNFMKIDEIN